VAALATDIGTRAAAAITALALPGVTVAVRKTPSLPEGTTAPQVVVSVGDEEEVERLTAVTKSRRVKFTVTLVTGGGTVAQDDATARDWWDRIQDAIYDKQRAAFSAIPSYIHLRATGGTVYDRAALSKDWNYLSQSYEFQAIETLAT
jgi:hypothetical protein